MGGRAVPAYLPGCPWACTGPPPRTRPGTIRCDHGRCLPRSPLRRCSELETKRRMALAGRGRARRAAGSEGGGRLARERGHHAVGHVCQLTTRPSAMNQGTWQCPSDGQCLQQSIAVPTSPVLFALRDRMRAPDILASLHLILHVTWPLCPLSWAH